MIPSKKRKLNKKEEEESEEEERIIFESESEEETKNKEESDEEEEEETIRFESESEEEKEEEEYLWRLSNIERAIKSFSSHSIPEHLHGREEKESEITNYIKERIKTQTSGSMYISGKPGTGKTATIQKIRKDLSLSKVRKCKQFFLNCMELKDKRQIYKEIGKTLELEDVERLDSDVISSALRKRNHMIIIFLDEIDQLMSTKSKSEQQIVFDIFGWTTIPNSHLVVVGIANALDMTEHIPLLDYIKCQPYLIHFQGYEADQISRIIKERLDSSAFTLVEDNAITLASRCIANNSSDVRVVLSILRKAVEDLKTKFEETRKISTVGVMLMNQICTQFLGDPQVNQIKSRTIHEKILLASLCQNQDRKEVVGSQVKKQYSGLCSQFSIPENNVSEICR
eukprot:TRINITY_DN2882_c0_g1_i9.p1 TRINITY_DN2882_c0_g1~~TRINITY_DN2882_c0_g1_i9.p1  ORF type:complete len:398 (+),score=110.86 TRINITY_DN2882_c0_g1_i9:114-1307(+)